jgi:hypothetical protein
MVLLDATSSVPATLKQDKDIEAYTSTEGDSSYTGRNIVAKDSGSHLIVCELGPGLASMMHRTVSIDYVICTHGHLRMETDTGEMIDLNPGVRPSSSTSSFVFFFVSSFLGFFGSS